MILKKWEDLPDFLRTDAVRPYYDNLARRKGSLLLKRCFDVAVSALMLVLLCPVFLVLAAAIKLDSPGPVFYRQVRVTQYGRQFRIFKFRSMVSDADRRGSLVTVSGDSRITRVGRIIRSCRLDELCQLLDVFRGTMTFVGTRPEVPRYVAAYTPEMLATLLLPAGVTSRASILYKDEAELLDAAEDVDTVYIRDVLPGKMKYNLEELRNFSFFSDIHTMIRTVFAVLGR
jgi:lipopolysaccharide/colanic/teichoic acid biosynthesis glycosyltransferase